MIFSSLLISTEDAFAALFVSSKDVSTEGADPRGITFNTDGTKMFVVDSNANEVNEYACTNSFDLSTCSATSVFSVAGQETSAQGIRFNADGTRLIIVGFASDIARGYSCPTGFDITTCTTVGVQSSPNLSAQEATSTGIAFNTDGTKMFIVGVSSDRVHEYTCTTGFDVSTCTDDADPSPSLNAQDDQPHDLAFNDDGTKMFIAGRAGNEINEYNCTAFDVSTCVYSGDAEQFLTTTQTTAPNGLTFSSDGLTLFVVGSIPNLEVHQYSLGIAFDVSSDPIPTTTNPSGSGSYKHQTRPTFGLDHNTFQQLIEGGFSFNGVSHDITHNFWTPFEEQKIKLGEINSFSAKVFAKEKLRVQEFLFGIPQVGEAHNAELGVEIFYNRDGTIERVQVIQKTDIIDIDSVQVIKSLSKCLSNETDEKCVTTLLSMKFLEPLKHKIMAIKAIDFKGRVHTTYLNEGFDISGDSLNPMNTKLIPGTVKYEGLIEITQTAKYSDIWVAKDGREFQINEFGTVNQINQSSELHIETDALKNRNSLEFSALKLHQINMAQILVEKLYPRYTEEPYGEINDIFAYGNQQFIAKNEIPKAEIDRDDRPISVILAEERQMKKILGDERANLKRMPTPQQ